MSRTMTAEAIAHDQSANMARDFAQGLGAQPANLPVEDAEELEPGQRGPCEGHVWSYTGTAYGGEDERWNGEGRCICIYCGADGDA